MSKKQRSRSNGEGTVYKRKDGRWISQITVGVDPKTGKSKRKSYYGMTRKEAVEKMNKVLSDIQSGNYIEPSSVTVEKWLNDWLEGRRPHIAESTWDSYENMTRCHIVPELGKIKLKDLKARDVQTLLNKKFESGRADGKGGLSAKTVKYIHAILESSLKQAVKERLIKHNVAEVVELPKGKKKEMRVFTKEQLKVFLKIAKVSPHYDAFLLELSTGLRRGELLGLHWQDINFNNRTITIRQQLTRSKNGLVFREPKTDKSRRVISLPKEIVDALKVHKKEQNEYKLKLGQAYKDGNLVFCIEDGSPIDPRNFTRHFELLVKKAGLEPIRFHDLSYPNLNKIQTFFK